MENTKENTSAPEVKVGRIIRTKCERKVVRPLKVSVTYTKASVKHGITESIDATLANMLEKQGKVIINR